MYLECQQMPLFPYNPQVLSPDSWPRRRDDQTSDISEGSEYQQQGNINSSAFSSKTSLDPWPSCLKDEPLKILGVFFFCIPQGSPRPCCRMMVIRWQVGFMEPHRPTPDSIREKLPFYQWVMLKALDYHVHTASSLRAVRTSQL